MSAVSASTLLLARVGKLWQHEQAGRWTAYASTLPVQEDVDVKLGAA